MHTKKPKMVQLIINKNRNAVGSPQITISPKSIHNTLQNGCPFKAAAAAAALNQYVLNACHACSKIKQQRKKKNNSQCLLDGLCVFKAFTNYEPRVMGITHTPVYPRVPPCTPRVPPCVPIHKSSLIK